jgi:hypothetical protein
MTDFINKNDRQLHFNRVRGFISELNDEPLHCSITILVGHENPRPVNFYCKKNEFDKHVQKVKIGDKVSIMFFLASKKNGTRWHTYANVLSVEIDDYKKTEATSTSVTFDSEGQSK